MQGYLSRLHRVYLVDDHDIVRRGVRDLLIPARDIKVVGDTGSAREAVPEILQLAPDVMLLDLHLQDGTGIEVCRAVRSKNPSIVGLLLTAAGDDEAGAAAVLAGAAGFIVKVSRSSNIMNTVRQLGPGTTLMDSDSVGRATRLLESTIDSLKPTVTEDEHRILELLVGGMTDSQITQTLASSEHDPGAKIVDLVARLTQALLTGP